MNVGKLRSFKFLEIFSCARYHIHIALYALSLSFSSVTQFACLFVLWSRWKDFCVSLFVSGILSIYLPLVICPFTFTEKFGGDKINLVLSVISIITVLVKLLQMICICIASFVACQSFYWFISLYRWKIFSEHKSVMSLLLDFSGTWNFKKELWGDLDFKGELGPLGTPCFQSIEFLINSRIEKDAQNYQRHQVCNC